MRPLFDLYFCLCINAAFLGQARIHCLPHADSKNIIGVCALVIYLVPGALLHRFVDLLIQQFLQAKSLTTEENLGWYFGRLAL